MDIQKEKTKIAAIRYSAGLAGNIAGIIYANKTGGGFWRYVGFALLGGFIVGGIAAIATMPAAVRVSNFEAETKK